MSNEQGKRWVQSMLDRHGCIPALSDGGTTIAAFSPEALGQAILDEVAKASQFGFTKITLHLDIPDAVKLGRHLKEKL